jgi:hypothetical protein
MHFHLEIHLLGSAGAVRSAPNGPHQTIARQLLGKNTGMPTFPRLRRRQR